MIDDIGSKVKMAFYDGFILRIVHLILFTYTAVCTWFTVLWRKPELLQHRKRTLDRYRADSKNITKLPNHLSLVVVESKISYSDIASVIVWCVAAGISCISVYDTQGIFKRNAVELTNHIAEKQKELLKEDESKFTFELFTKGSEDNEIRDITSKSPSDASYQRQNCHKPKVILLGPEDGRAGLVHLSQQICEESLQRRHLSEQLGINDVDNYIKASWSFPDPDLVLRFGTFDSLMGFLPWQIRLTEILSYPTHWGIDYKSFLGLLQHYSHTKQRFGK